ncbi:MAG: hypothetical protein KAU06_09035 [Candidatus Marinimicrobia bacterium]|nr:hypothetical protein [Candidatus Neomarinimicrobiota bacterium]
MKTIRVMTAVVLLATVMFGQNNFEQTTLFQKGAVLGGYGGPAISIGKLNGEYAVFTGGSGAFVLNHRFIIGGAGYGLVNRIDISPEGIPGDSSRYLNMGYGGLELGYIIAPSQLVHIQVSSLFGVGGLGTHNNVDIWDEDYDEDDFDVYHDVFFVLQPTVSLELNVAKFCRLNVGATYRYALGFDYKGLKTGDLDGLELKMALNFGLF